MGIFVCIGMFTELLISGVAVLLFVLFTVFLPCCLPSSSPNWCAWSWCFRRSLFLQLVWLETVTPLNVLSGAGRAEPPVISLLGVDGPKAQMVAPLSLGGTKALVITSPVCRHCHVSGDLLL